MANAAPIYQLYDYDASVLYPKVLLDSIYKDESDQTSHGMSLIESEIATDIAVNPTSPQLSTIIPIANAGALSGMQLNFDSSFFKVRAYNAEEKISLTEILNDIVYPSINGQYVLAYDSTSETPYPHYIDQCVLSNTESLTYSTLIARKNDSRLTPGCRYRIIDYETVCSSSYVIGGNTVYISSARHKFDVIVTAVDGSTLSENASAAASANDTYFTNCNLNTWKLKYCPENDATRFVWANAANGKGVIYYMEDEFGNSAGYDFKNILFKRKWNADSSMFSDNGTSSDVLPGEVYAPLFAKDSSTGTETQLTDMSIDADNEISTNIIGEEVSKGKRYLPDICIFGTNIYDNIFGSGCYMISLGTGCHENSFGPNCHNNVLKAGAYSNIMEQRCYNIHLGNAANNYLFGPNCYNYDYDSSVCAGSYCFIP